MKVVTDGDQTRVSRVFFREGLSGKEDVEALADAGAIGETDRIVLVGHDRLRDGDTVTSRSRPSPAARPSPSRRPLPMAAEGPPPSRSRRSPRSFGRSSHRPVAVTMAVVAVCVFGARLAPEAAR